MSYDLAYLDIGHHVLDDRAREDAADEYRQSLIDSAVDEFLEGKYKPTDPHNLWMGLGDIDPSALSPVCNALESGNFEIAGKLMLEIATNYCRINARQEAEILVDKELSDNTPYYED